MRMMLTASLPNEPFNSLLRAGTVGLLLQEILAQLKPEAAYFVEDHGMRCGVLIVVSDQSRIPFFAEPFFLKFNATCRFRIAMVADDLARADLDALGKSGNRSDAKALRRSAVRCNPLANRAPDQHCSCL
jgi:hypothetical protein